jgi:glycosyltransferase involved in cell wall biosynthesis
MIPLSIIIPIYNVEKYIEKCLDSVFQSNKNIDFFEVIIVNDGTPDGSMEIVSDFTKLFNNITVLNQENRGLGAARNAGAKLAKGKYLWFVDSDDWLVHNAIDNILNCVNLHNPEILAIDYTYSTGEKSTIKNYAKPGKVYTGKDYLNINYVQNPVQYYVIKSSFYFMNNLSFKMGIYHEDSLFTPKALFLADCVMFYDVPCYIYNVREGSIMTSTNACLKHSSDMMTVSVDLYHFMESNAKNLTDKRILSKYISTALGGLYYYWKQLNSKDKTIISRKFPFRLFLKPLFINFQFKYILSSFIIGVK